MTNYSGDVIEVTGNRKSENFGYDFFDFEISVWFSKSLFLIAVIFLSRKFGNLKEKSEINVFQE